MGSAQSGDGPISARVLRSGYPRGAPLRGMTEGIGAGGGQGTHEGHPYGGGEGIGAGGGQGTHEGHPYGGGEGIGAGGVQGTHEGHPYGGGVVIVIGRVV